MLVCWHPGSRVHVCLCTHMSVTLGVWALGVLLHCGAVRGWGKGSYIRFPSQIKIITLQYCFLPAGSLCWTQPTTVNNFLRLSRQPSSQKHCLFKNNNMCFKWKKKKRIAYATVQVSGFCDSIHIHMCLLYINCTVVHLWGYMSACVCLLMLRSPEYKLHGSPLALSVLDIKPYNMQF